MYYEILLTNGEQEEYEVPPENASKYTKLRIRVINRLKKIRHKILMNLRRIIFGSEDYNTENKEQDVDEKIEHPKIEMNIQFNEKIEDRKDDLKDIEVYLDDEKNPFECKVLSSISMINQFSQ